MNNSYKTATHIFLKEIMETSPLSREEEQELFKLYVSGNQKARSKLLCSNMRFVLKVAQKYRMAPVPLSDIIAEGAMGLIRAIESFDPSRGLRFISYAVWWINVYINRAVTENGSLIRLPAHKNIEVKKAIKARAQGKKISKEVQQLVAMVEKKISLDAKLSTTTSTSFADIIPDNTNSQPDNIALKNSIRVFLREVIAELPEREATILKGLYGIDFGNPETLEQMSHTLNLSKERVRQLRDRALKRLKKSRYHQKLKENFEGCKESWF